MSGVVPAVANPATPAARPRRRAVLGWAIIAVVLVVVGFIGAFLSGIGQWTDRGALDPEGAGPDGTRALAQLLREQGVDVTVTHSRTDAIRALGSGDATLVTADAPALSDEAMAALFDAAQDVVLVGPRTRAVELLIPGSTASGFARAEPIDPDCSVPEARRAGALVVGRTFDSGTSGAVGCYPGADGFGLLVAELPGGEGRRSVIDGEQLLTNAHLAENGNASLGLSLMGRHSSLVWYVPSPADTDLADTTPSLGALTPGWVTPAIVLLALAAVAAAVWRGRRFGPLVVERLPVTVRASETMQGRARLYAQGRDHVHAADALRIGTIARIITPLGLSATTDVRTVADAAADVLGVPREGVRALLIDDRPHTDRELMIISDRLQHLEQAVRSALLDEGRTP